jgi:hypothetical protein
VKRETGPFAASFNGTIAWATVGATRREAWFRTFDLMPETFRTVYWKREDASRRAAARQGIRIVAVDVVERSAPKG